MKTPDRAARAADPKPTVEETAALRDQFAMAALTGIYANPHNGAYANPVGGRYAAEVAALAYAAADAMLARRASR